MPSISRIMQMVACQMDTSSGTSNNYVDWTDASWIELDPNSTMTVTANTITLTNITKNEEAYIYKDYGAAYFNGDFEHQFEINVPTSGTGTPTCGIWCVANDLDDYRGLDQSSKGAAIRATGFTVSDWDLRLSLEFQGTSNNINALSYNTTYYCTVTRDDDGGVNNTGRYVLTAYSDSDRTIVVDDATVDAYEGNQKDFRYLYSCGAYNMSEAGSAISLVVSNLELVS